MMIVIIFLTLESVEIHFINTRAFPDELVWPTVFWYPHQYIYSAKSGSLQNG